MDSDKLIKELMENMQALRVASRKGEIQENIMGEMYVLRYAKERSCKVIPSDISNALGVSTARVANALNSLEEKGFITRTIDSEDRRKIIVEVTPEGAAYVDEQMKRSKARLEELLLRLGEADSEELVRITGRLAEILKEAAGEKTR